MTRRTSSATGPHIHAIRTHRQLQELFLNGWSSRELSRRLEKSEGHVKNIMARDTIRASTAEEIRDLYLELRGTTGSSVTAQIRAQHRTEKLGMPTRGVPELGNHMKRVRSVDWTERAVCKQVVTKDHDPFFPPEDGDCGAHAKKVCQGCPVRAQCLEYALDNNEVHGVWGGFGPQERAKMRRQRALL